MPICKILTIKTKQAFASVSFRPAGAEKLRKIFISPFRAVKELAN
jgi:hypothetical protein